MTKICIFGAGSIGGFIAKSLKKTNEKVSLIARGDNKEARETVIQLISKISLKGWHCGSIDNAVVAESLTPVLIFMNKFYNFKGSGIKIVDESMIQ